MTLKDIKTKQAERGFTLVELLIVIVVIGILAAIVIVAYNGVQNRAKTTAGQALSDTLAKKIEAYNSVNGSYPTYCQLVTNSVSPTGAQPAAGTPGVGTCASGGSAAGTESKVDDTSTVTPTQTNVGGSYTSTVSNVNKVVGIWMCGATVGANVFYWDYSANAIVTKKVGAGC